MGFGDGDWVCFVRGVGVGVLGFKLQPPGQDLHYNQQVYYQSYLQYTSQAALIINLPQLYLHLEFVNRDLARRMGSFFIQ